MKHSLGLAQRTLTQLLENVRIAYFNTSHQLMDGLDFDQLYDEVVQTRRGRPR